MAQERDNIVRSSVITAFTIAAALIWKDVFTEAVNTFVPQGEHLVAQFVSATVATAFIIISLKLFLTGEEKAEKVLKEVEDIMEGHDHRQHHRSEHMHKPKE